MIEQLGTLRTAFWRLDVLLFRHRYTVAHSVSPMPPASHIPTNQYQFLLLDVQKHTHFLSGYIKRTDFSDKQEVIAERAAVDQTVFRATQEAKRISTVFSGKQRAKILSNKEIKSVRENILCVSTVSNKYINLSLSSLLR